jgi:hypothetical protein
VDWLARFLPITVSTACDQLKWRHTIKNLYVSICPYLNIVFPSAQMCWDQFKGRMHTPALRLAAYSPAQNNNNDSFCF